jgi:hypothetical protein
MPRIAEEESLRGVLGYLVKPVIPDALMAIMKQIERKDETTVLLVDDDPMPCAYWNG